MPQPLLPQLLQNSIRILTLLALCGLSFCAFSFTAHAAGLSKPANSLGLVGYWPLDEGTTTSAGDVSGNRNTGTLLNSPTWVSGRHGRALQFNGTTQGVSIPDSSSLEISADLTLAAWVYYDGDFSDYRTIIDGGASGWNLSVQSQTGKAMVGKTGITDVCAGNTVLPVGWHFLAATRSGNNYTVYVDGVSDGTCTSATAYTVTNTKYIGQAATGSYWRNKIDDARVYNRALTAAQIRTLYGQGQATVKQANGRGLVGEWLFDEGTSTLAGDSSGNRNTGTIAGTPTWANGRHGKALSFDASSNYISIPDSPSLDPTNGVTVSMWGYKNNTNVNGQGVSKNDAVAATTPYEIQWWSDGRVYFNFYTTGGFIGNVDCPYTANTWYYAVGTYDGTTARGYLNGVQCDTNSTSGTLNTNTKSLYIGSSGTSGKFGGRIDDVRVYSRALSATEVAALYRSKEIVSQGSQANRISGGLVSYWSFNGADFTDKVYDRVGGKNGYLPSGVATSSTKTFGVVGQGIQFNGSTSYVNLGASNRFSFTTQSTMSGWVKTSNTHAQRVLILQRATGSTAVGIEMSNDAAGNDASDGKPAGRYRSASGVAIAKSSGPISDNQWHHIAWVINGSNGTLYVDGVSTSTVSDVDDTNTYALTSDIATISSQNASSQFFNGSVDEMRIYNRALSAAEIKQLYDMGR